MDQEPRLSAALGARRRSRQHRRVDPQSAQRSGEHPKKTFSTVTKHETYEQHQGRVHRGAIRGHRPMRLMHAERGRRGQTADRLRRAIGRDGGAVDHQRRQSVREERLGRRGTLFGERPGAAGADCRQYNLRRDDRLVDGGAKAARRRSDHGRRLFESAYLPPGRAAGNQNNQPS